MVCLKEAKLTKTKIKNGKQSYNGPRYHYLYTFADDGQEFKVEGIPIMMTCTKSCHVFHACAFKPQLMSSLRVFDTIQGDPDTLENPMDCGNIQYKGLMAAIDKVVNTSEVRVIFAPPTTLMMMTLLMMTLLMLLLMLMTMMTTITLVVMMMCLCGLSIACG